MDLSKAYDCIPHDLVKANLEAYGLDTNSLRFLFDYLCCRKQRTKMRSAYSNWSEVLRGIPQGSILLSPMLFNIFINDIFIRNQKKSEIYNFADVNTCIHVKEIYYALKKILYLIWKMFFFWFRTNSLKANTVKLQFMILNRKNHRRQRMVINSITVKESNEVMLRYTIDNKLVF